MQSILNLKTKFHVEIHLNHCNHIFWNSKGRFLRYWNENSLICTGDHQPIIEINMVKKECFLRDLMLSAVFSSCMIFCYVVEICLCQCATPRFCRMTFSFECLWKELRVLHAIWSGNEVCIAWILCGTSSVQLAELIKIKQHIWWSQLNCAISNEDGWILFRTMYPISISA